MDKFKKEVDNVLYKAEIGYAETLHMPCCDDASNNLTIKDLYRAIEFIGEFKSWLGLVASICFSIALIAGIAGNSHKS